MDVSGVHLSAEAATLLDVLMAFVPPPLAPFARTKIVAGAAQLAARKEMESSSSNGVVGIGPVARSFWKGTPEPMRDPVRQVLQQMGLWHHVENPPRG